MSTRKVDVSFLKTDFSKSIAGFFAALIIGALIPRTIQFLMRKVVLKSVKDFVILALAGWLTERLAHLIASSEPKKLTDK